MDFKERLLSELTTLVIKIDRLANYLEKQNANEDFSLEKTQLNIMLQYRECLEQRILKLMK